MPTKKGIYRSEEALRHYWWLYNIGGDIEQCGRNRKLERKDAIRNSIGWRLVEKEKE